MKRLIIPALRPALVWGMLTLSAIMASAQTTSPLTVEVSAVTGVSTQGLTVTLSGEESGWVFDPVKVKADGTAKFSYVPEGTFTLTVDGAPLGLEKYVDNSLEHHEAQTVEVVLREAVRNPYALQVALNHDDFTGVNSALLSWNRETDYFFDDFESYEPFAISFDPWTGYDLDKEPAAEIQGGYLNRGLQQYATIFNPLEIDPPVYYEYEVLRPYSGKQCVGFVRTRSGAANNDWLISPKIKVGVGNIVSFMAKASEYTPDRFAVAISTSGTDLKDFVQLTPGNYQTVDYKQWYDITYDLSAYEGQEVYIAIHCMSQNGFMLMVDDFYVGPKSIQKKARRVNRHSAANPNEKFTVSLDGNKIGETEGYDFAIESLPEGKHVLGVKATYLMAESEESIINVEVAGAEHYAALEIRLSTDVDHPLKGTKISLLNTGDARQTLVTADEEGKARIGYLAKGNYMLNVTSNVFEEYNATLLIDGDKTLDIALEETITDPFNLFYQTTANDDGETFRVEFSWNQDLGYRDSFETYHDFAQTFGDWTVLDLDQMPTYAFSIGGINITLPEMRGKVGAMVFNPYATQPVKASEDGLFLAPDGDKYVMFNSAEQAQSNDWLISPTLKIGPDYVFRFSAKSYTNMYPGVFEFCALKGKDIAGASLLDAFSLTEDWMRYEISLRAYEGESIEIGFHHITSDGWISFIDDIYVGPGDERTGEGTDNLRCTFDVYLDGVFMAHVTEPAYVFPALEAGTHKAGIQAIYPSGRKSALVEMEFTVDSNGVAEIVVPDERGWRYFDLNGLEVNPLSLPKGIYIRTNGIVTEKVMN